MSSWKPGLPRSIKYIRLSKIIFGREMRDEDRYTVLMLKHMIIKPQQLKYYGEITKNRVVLKEFRVK